MDTRTFIPNERRVIVAIRYDSGQMAEDDLIANLDAHLGELNAKFVKPEDVVVADGAFDWSLTTTDRIDPVAKIRVLGEVIQADSLLPIMIIDDDTLVAETWLDGEILKEETIPPEGLPNHLSLANGRLVTKIKELMNIEQRDKLGVPKHVPNGPRNTIDENRYHLPDPGEEAPEACGIVGCEVRAWVKNPTARPEWLCEPHYLQRTELYRTRQLVPYDAAEQWLTYVGEDWPTAHRLEAWLARPCLRCQLTYGEHYGERCPINGTTFTGEDAFIGYDPGGQTIYRGDEERIYYNRIGERILPEDREAAIAKLHQEANEYYEATALVDVSTDAKVDTGTVTIANANYVVGEGENAIDMEVDEAFGARREERRWREREEYMRALEQRIR